MDRRQLLITRLLVALAMGLVGGGLAWYWLTSAPRSDFEYSYIAARLLAAGLSPYDGRLWPLDDPYYPYPITSALILVPLTGLSLHWAGAVFFGVASALLAFGLTRRPQDGPWPLLTFATPAYLLAARLGQWTPLITAAALVPPLGALISLKPSLGLALFVAYPNRWRWTVLGSGILVMIAFAVRPSWFVEWQSTLRADTHHLAPISLPGGFLLLAAVTRWRRPEARLLVVLALMPQIYLFADQLLLTLIPRTTRERVAQAVLMWVGFIAAAAVVSPSAPALDAARLYVLAAAYLPALVMVLRRPNEGEVPRWVERITALRAARTAPHTGRRPPSS